MTTLLITDLFPPKVGGSVRFYWEVYRRLAQAGLVVASGEHPDQEAFDATHDLRVHRLPLTLHEWGVLTFSGSRGYFRANRSLRRLAVAEDVAHVHCGRCLPEGLMSLSLKRSLGLPYLCYVWGEELTFVATSRELTLLARQVLHRAQRLLTCSLNTRRILVEQWGVPKDRITLLYPGVDTKQFQPSAEDPKLRESLGWKDRTVILTVSRLQKRKGHDKMIPALIKIKQTVPNVLYSIVGDGEERKTLEELVEQENLQDHVQFMGELGMADGKLVQCYQQCNLFVLPNREVNDDIEGFGMVMIEAQACGKPVIGGMCGGTPETLSMPETGYIVNCEHSDELAERVTQILTDTVRLREMGAAARKWTVEQFDWESVANKAKAIFSQL